MVKKLWSRIPTWAVAIVSLLVVGGFMMARALDSSVPLDAPTVPGVVVAVGSSKNNWIKVEYTLPDGRRFRAKTSEFGTEDWVVGRTVTVRYDPADPEDIGIGDFRSDRSFEWLATGGFGVAILVVAGAAVRRSQVVRRSSGRTSVR